MATISLHRAPDTWALLYRLLWKVHERGSPILGNSADPDIIDAERRAKQVSRDIHKMHAFVRFRRVEQDNDHRFVAWHRPQHYIVRAGAEFFKRRFGAMKWSILTPDESVHWDLEKLSYTEGVASSPPIDDEFEGYWLTYYSSIFNPARLKIAAMKKEMPTRYWESMPETRLIESLVEDAPTRVSTMQDNASAGPTLPACTSIEALRAACSTCSACPIACLGGKAVFGEGEPSSPIMLVGEQPGDEEDRSGRPFVGPAGQLLDAILAKCGINRKELYVTNAVKHFKWIPSGSGPSSSGQSAKRRLHQRPSGSEILACKPWLLGEIEIGKPRVIVCLGASAAQSILGIKVSVIAEVNRSFEGPNGSEIFVTYHPSAALRAPSPEKRCEIEAQIERSLSQARLRANEVAIHSDS